MNDRIRDFVRRVNPTLFAFLKGVYLLLDQQSFLRSSGLLHSYQVDRPCKPDGSPLPWMNYNVIAFLEERLRASMRLFEYGSGYSTLFFAAHVDRVVSVENDPAWYRQVKSFLPENVNLLYRPLESGAYCDAVLQNSERYHVVVVDGRQRACCANAACQALDAGGVIVFDDTRREQYAPALQSLQSQGFKRLDFIGFKPTGVELDQTSILYRPANCFGL